MLLAKLVGEGFDRPGGDSELPLDINYAKISEWLVDRKLVPQEWNRKLQAIQAKAADAAKELPPGFLAQFGGEEDAPVDYFLAKQVLGVLSETAERGLLGSLKGAAGAWERVVRAYEANMLHVAEAGLTLARNADYEVPFHRRQAAKNQQLVADLERRQGEAAKSAAAAAAEFRAECEGLGVGAACDAGGGAAELRQGLAGLAAELPALMGSALEAAAAPEVGAAAEYYAAFTATLQQGGGGGGGGAAPAELLPTLAEVRAGRTQAPEEGAAEEEGAAGEAPQVDWDLGGGGGGGGGGEEGNGMSWDLDAPADGGGGEIAWDVVEAPEEEGEAAEPSGAPAVSWDIDVSGAGEAAAAAGDAASGTPAPPPRAAQSGREAAAAALRAAPPAVRRLAADAGYRSRLLDDLHELKAFLRQRRAELHGAAGLAAAAPAAVAAVDADRAGALAAAVDGALAALTGPRLARLVSLSCSARYRDRLLAALVRRAGQEAKFRGAGREAGARRDEAQRQLVAGSARLAAALRRTRAAKAGAEAALGARLGRRVHVQLQGEVNALLAAQH